MASFGRLQRGSPDPPLRILVVLLRIAPRSSIKPNLVVGFVGLFGFRVPNPWDRLFLGVGNKFQETEVVGVNRR